MADQSIKTLVLMPGGAEACVQTITSILSYIETQTVVSRDMLRNWISEQYKVQLKTTRLYVQSLTRLALIHKLGQQHYQLTEYGELLLEAPGQEASARLLLDKMMPHYEGLLEILQICIEADGVIEILEIEYRAQMNANALSDRLYWLLGLGCIEQVDYTRSYIVTAFGLHIYRAHVTSEQSLSARITQSIEAAATDGEHPHVFEQVVAEGFEFLGYHVELMGGRGETDLLVTALLGSQTYRFIVDTKARGEGKLQQLDVLTLQEHQAQAAADHAVVIAAAFGGGKLQRQAVENHITLMTTGYLCNWIRYHAAFPCDLLTYQDCITSPGKHNNLPPSLQHQQTEAEALVQLLIEVLDLLVESYQNGFQKALPASQIYTMLFTKAGRMMYTEHQIQHVLNLLQNPIMSALPQEVEAELRMAPHTVKQRLLWVQRHMTE